MNTVEAVAVRKHRAELETIQAYAAALEDPVELLLSWGRLQAYLVCK